MWQPKDNPRCLPRSLPPGIFEAVSLTMTHSFLLRLGPVNPWICRSLPTEAGITSVYPVPNFLHECWLSNSGLHVSALYRLICLPGPESIVLVLGYFHFLFFKYLNINYLKLGTCTEEACLEFWRLVSMMSMLSQFS